MIMMCTHIYDSSGLMPYNTQKEPPRENEIKTSNQHAADDDAALLLLLLCEADDEYE